LTKAERDAITEAVVSEIESAVLPVDKSDSSPEFKLDIAKINCPVEPKYSEALSSMIHSVGRQGICTPLTVRKYSNGRYGIVDGTLRYHAARQLGLPEVPVRVV
jgi:ParB-like chromosome segregation protein Spo0J